MAANYKTPEYHAWSAMWQRCTCRTHPHFKDYGGRGITVCARWENFPSFLYDMGPRPSNKHSLDRKENDQGYFPGNCQWSTQDRQSANQRGTIWIEFNGERLPVSAWARKIGVSKHTLFTRLKYGWSVERLLSPPTKAARNQYSKI